MILQIFQPEGSSLCGQTCVAMIEGVNPEQSIEAFGDKKGTTRTKEVVAALRKLGLNCGDPPLTRVKGKLPDTCIVKLHFDWTTNTHWVLWHNRRFYDPSDDLKKRGLQSPDRADGLVLAFANIEVQSGFAFG